MCKQKFDHLSTVLMQYGKQEYFFKNKILILEFVKYD